MQKFAIGSYTSSQGHAPDARGRGLSIIGLSDSESPEVLMEISVYEKLENPAYLAWDKSRGIIYAASEMGASPGRIDALFQNESGEIKHLSGCRGDEKDACHISLSADGSALHTASYGSGRVSAFNLKSDGAPSLSGTVSYEGSGPNRERQESPHAHQIVPSPFSEHLYVCDLGTDKIWLQNQNPETFSQMEEKPIAALELPGGYGPRHLVIDDRKSLAYILCELVPRIIVARINSDDGKMEIIQDISSTSDKEGSTPPLAPAAIKLHPSGKTLAVSNRFRDTVAVFAIKRDSDAAKLTFSGEYPCGGKTPRDMEFDSKGSLLLIANQDSHNISSLHFDTADGFCTGEKGPEMETGSPVCIINLS